MGEMQTILRLATLLQYKAGIRAENFLCGVDQKVSTQMASGSLSREMPNSNTAENAREEVSDAVRCPNGSAQFLALRCPSTCLFELYRGYRRGLLDSALGTCHDQTALETYSGRLASVRSDNAHHNHHYHR